MPNLLSTLTGYYYRLFLKMKGNKRPFFDYIYNDNLMDVLG